MSNFRFIPSENAQSLNSDVLDTLYRYNGVVLFGDEELALPWDPWSFYVVDGNLVIEGLLGPGFSETQVTVKIPISKLENLGVSVIWEGPMSEDEINQLLAPCGWVAEPMEF